MAHKKLLMAAGALTTLGAAVTLGLGVATAATDVSNPLVDKLAARFKLDKGEVQKVFDEAHAERKAEHHAHMTERLDQAVKDGSLTEAQKDKILAKLEELEANRPNPEDMHGKSPEELHKLKEQKHAELKKWAEENGIPEEFMPLRVKIRMGPMESTGTNEGHKPIN